jgi:hypothetical protein
MLKSGKGEHEISGCERLDRYAVEVFVDAELLQVLKGYGRMLMMLICLPRSFTQAYSDLPQITHSSAHRVSIGEVMSIHDVEGNV